MSIADTVGKSLLKGTGKMVVGSTKIAGKGLQKGVSTIGKSLIGSKEKKVLKKEERAIGREKAVAKAERLMSKTLGVMDTTCRTKDGFEL